MTNEKPGFSISTCKYLGISLVILVLILVPIQWSMVNRWNSAHSWLSSSFFGSRFRVKYTDTELKIDTRKQKYLPNKKNKKSNNFIIKTIINDTAIKSELERRLKNATDKKVMLIWVTRRGIKNGIKIDAANCGKCEVTYDRTRISEKDTGAVVFHYKDTKPSDMPPIRNLNQLYILWNMESTTNVRVARNRSLKFEDEFQFNATLTYRRDSEFYASYERRHSSTVIEQNKWTSRRILKAKTKSAVAIVSHCNGYNGVRTRLRLLKQLMKLGLNMEGYGQCFIGKGIFANGSDRGTVQFAREVRKYKFYFSFENSYHCKDYITEKFFRNALNSLTVPVVWGAKKEDYEAVAPPGSFIFAEDFTSMKDLANYLKFLMQNDTEYLKYFSWLTMKPSNMPQYGRARGLCAVCRALHGINIDDIYNPKYNSSNPPRPLFTEGIAQRTIPHLIDWYYGEENPECFIL